MQMCDLLIKSEETVKLLGIQLDYKLNFEHHIIAPCKKLHHNSMYYKDSNNLPALIKINSLSKAFCIQILIIAS